MKLTFNLLLLVDRASCEESEGLSLLQTRVHVHSHSNETRGECTDEDGETSICWPGYKFADFLPAGCISQGSDVQERGRCDQLVTPSRVKAANKVLGKVGCVTGNPNSLAWRYVFNYDQSEFLKPGVSTAEDRKAIHAKCIKLGETDENCAGANVMTITSNYCACGGGVVTFYRNDADLSCALKSRPAAENPTKYDSGGRKEARTSIVEQKELTGCSKGWWVMAGGFIHKQGSGDRLAGKPVTGWLDQAQTYPQYRTPAHHWNNQKAWTQPAGRYGANTWDIAGLKPSECAQAIKKCTDEQNPNCKDIMTGQWPKGASMTAEQTRSNCKAWYGDVSEAVGAVTGEKAPEGALWPNEARWMCLLDDGDYTAGDMMLEGAKKSGKYKEGGKKEKTPKEEKCKVSKATRAEIKAARAARNEARQALKDAKAAVKAAKLSKDRAEIKAAKAARKAARKALKDAKAALKAAKAKAKAECE